MPNEELRLELWKKMLPNSWLKSGADELLRISSEEEFSGGAIANIIRSCALQLLDANEEKLSIPVLKLAIQKEKMK